MNDELKFLIKLVKDASLLINDEFEIKVKDENGDLVTNFDYAIEKYITNKIKEKYPQFSIISEEYNSKEGLTDNCFTIDPIDGTINFAYVASGKLSATNFIFDTLWDYIPGQYIVQQAGGVIYNDTKMHIAASNEEFLQIIKNNSSVNIDEKLTLIKN